MVVHPKTAFDMELLAAWVLLGSCSRLVGGEGGCPSSNMAPPVADGGVCFSSMSADYVPFIACYRKCCVVAYAVSRKN